MSSKHWKFVDSEDFECVQWYLETGTAINCFVSPNNQERSEWVCLIDATDGVLSHMVEVENQFDSAEDAKRFCESWIYDMCQDLLNLLDSGNECGSDWDYDDPDFD